MQDYSGYGMPPADGGGYYGGPTSPLPQGPPPPPPRRRVGLLSYLAVALAAGALGAGAVVAVYHPASSASAAPEPSSSAFPAAPVAPAPAPSGAVPLPSSSSGTNAASSAVLKKVSPGVVIINTTLQYSSEAAAGTGMVLNSSGLVLTNNHVIENATKISATVLATGHTYPAKVVGYDVTGDIAEIQLQGASGLHTIPIGDSSQVKSGNSVVALGNAEGQSQIVAAQGRITGLNQSITASDQGGTVTSENLHGMFETDASIVAGDSGGPLSTTAGKVIGMDTAGNGGSFSQQQSTAGFAIPINTALAVARQISAGHASSTIVIGYPPFIGIYIGKGTSTSPQTQAQQQNEATGGGGGGVGGGGGFGNGSGSGCYTNDANLVTPTSIAAVSSGTLVLGTICDSPASSAGLTAGSVITSVNGQTVGSPHSLTAIMSKFHPGANVSVTWVTPAGQTKTGTLSLTPGPPL
jgi:S1-C subfamily serine protease